MVICVQQKGNTPGKRRNLKMKKIEAFEQAIENKVKDLRAEGINGLTEKA